MEGYITLVSNGEPIKVRAERAQDAIEAETGERPTVRQALFLTGAPMLFGLWKRGTSRGAPAMASPAALRPSGPRKAASAAGLLRAARSGVADSARWVPSTGRATAVTSAGEAVPAGDSSGGSDVRPGGPPTRRVGSARG
jgi:hypothetical protein